MQKRCNYKIGSNAWTWRNKLKYEILRYENCTQRMARSGGEQNISLAGRFHHLTSCRGKAAEYAPSVRSLATPTSALLLLPQAVFARISYTWNGKRETVPLRYKKIQFCESPNDMTISITGLRFAFTIDRIWTNDVDVPNYYFFNTHVKHKSRE